MHVDGHDSAVAEVVAADNLVQVMDADLAGLSNWVRMSGLTREEAALIQPLYPAYSDATLLELQTTMPVLNLNGYTISETVVRHAELDSPLSADSDWELERAMLDAQTTNATPTLNQINNFNGVLFGATSITNQRSVRYEILSDLTKNSQNRRSIHWAFSKAKMADCSTKLSCHLAERAEART